MSLHYKKIGLSLSLALGLCLEMSITASAEDIGFSNVPKTQDAEITDNPKNHVSTTTQDSSSQGGRTRYNNRARNFRPKPVIRISPAAFIKKTVGNVVLTDSRTCDQESGKGCDSQHWFFDIAREQYNDERAWAILYEINRRAGNIYLPGNPNHLLAGQRLIVPDASCPEMQQLLRDVSTHRSSKNGVINYYPEAIMRRTRTHPVLPKLMQACGGSTIK